MPPIKDERSEKLIEFILKHKNHFQVNLTRIEPVEKGKSSSNSLRAVPVLRYQTKEKIVSPYYKRISRCVE